MKNGKKNWIFPDGDLPPAGDGEPYGHEALMVANLGAKKARFTLNFFFEDRPPVKGLAYALESERVVCIRLDKPLGKEGFQVPFGQYALKLESDTLVVAVFGRLDRRRDMAYYSVQGHGW